MARRCSVCSHPKAHEINQALLSGATYRDISGRFDLSRTAVGNHAATHLPRRIAEGMEALSCDTVTAPPETLHLAWEARERAEIRTAESASLRDRLREDLTRLDRLYALAVANGNLSAANKTINTRWAILARAGLLANLDAAPDAIPEPEENVQGDLAALFREMMAPCPTEEEAAP